MIIRTSAWLLWLLLAPVAGSLYAADGYPNKPIRMILPGPPGGGADLLARMLAQRFTAGMGVAVIIDNRPGAGGMLGMDLAAKAASDGYTLVMGNSGPNAVIPNMQKNMPYDPVKDFAPISLVASTSNLLVVPVSASAKSVAELIQAAKAKPGQLTFASGGSGQSSHLSGELFKLNAGIAIVHVPYKGSGPALTDLLGGRVSMMFGNIPSVLPQVTGGRLRALAVTSAKRSKLAPQLPTMEEAGLPGYESTQWYGLLAPARTPARVLAKLNAETVAAVDLAEMQDSLSRQGFDPVGSTAGEFAVYINTELEKWKRVIAAAGITGE